MGGGQKARVIMARFTRPSRLPMGGGQKARVITACFTRLSRLPMGGGQKARVIMARFTSWIAFVTSISRGQASVQLKMVRQRHTPSLSLRISSRWAAPRRASRR